MASGGPVFAYVMMKSMVSQMKCFYLFLILVFGFLLIPGSWTSCNGEGCLGPDFGTENAAECIVLIEADLVGKNSLNKKHIHQFMLPWLDLPVLIQQ
jgi:hypothetical protein